jgi:hypothetical protein
MYQHRFEISLVSEMWDDHLACAAKATPFSVYLNLKKEKSCHVLKRED